MRKKEIIKDIEKSVDEPAQILYKVPQLIKENLLSSGSTLINLACTDKTFGCFLKGRYFFFVGDSSSGKTYFCLTMFAEANNNDNFSNYRNYYDDVEGGNLFDLQKFFGSKMAHKIEPPGGYNKKGKAVNSRTIEQFYAHLDNCIIKSKEEKRPFIYVLDSMDALDTLDDEEKFKEQKVDILAGKEVSGSYGTSKAKKNSELMRKILSGIEETDSILIIINQTRANLRAGLFGNPKTFTGGHAQKFYACLEIWTSVVETLTKVVNGRKRPVGHITRVHVRKNRLTGKDRIIDIPILTGYGLDEIGSCIDYLIAEKWWTVTKKKGDDESEDNSSDDENKKGKSARIVAEELNLTLKRNELISAIENDENLYFALKKAVLNCWRDIEEQLDHHRKKRYE